MQIYLRLLHDVGRVVYDDSQRRYHPRLHVDGNFHNRQDPGDLRHKANPKLQFQTFVS